MQPIDIDTIETQDLENVRGGFAALLGALPGIMQGVTGIIGAAKAGKGGGAPQGGPGGPPPGAPGGETAAAAQQAVGGGLPGGGGGGCGCGGGSISTSISINGLPQRTA